MSELKELRNISVMQPNFRPAMQDTAKALLDKYEGTSAEPALMAILALGERDGFPAYGEARKRADVAIMLVESGRIFKDDPTSPCCGAEIVNGLCSGCKEHC